MPGRVVLSFNEPKAAEGSQLESGVEIKTFPLQTLSLRCLFDVHREA